MRAMADGYRLFWRSLFIADLWATDCGRLPPLITPSENKEKTSFLSQSDSAHESARPVYP